MRHMATGHYFQSLEKWTLDRDDAYDFGIISKAVKVARKIRIPELELVLSYDDPDQTAATPFEKFLLGLSQKTRRPAASHQASRPWHAVVNI